jgi:hypothetical protein
VHRWRHGDRHDHRAHLTEHIAALEAALTAALTVEDIAAGHPLDLELDGLGRPARPLVVVDLAAAARLPAAVIDAAAARLRSALPVSVGVGVGDEPAELLDALSLTLVASEPSSLPAPREVVSVPSAGTALDRLRAAAQAAPRAAVALGRLLRQTEVLPVLDALVAESATYSTLLAGPEFAGWLRGRGEPRAPRPGTVEVTRDGDVVSVTVNRPDRRNAVDTATRDALVDALGLLADPDIRIELRGRGPSFGAGGDLDEFGSAPDPATAHVVRLEQSVGRAIDADRSRVTAFVHGACYGAGCEIPAFAGRVVAAADTTLALPELSLGLIPGAGGTVSVTRRIGRWRTAWMALTGDAVDAETALAWGLVDERAG